MMESTECKRYPSYIAIPITQSFSLLHRPTKTHHFPPPYHNNHASSVPKRPHAFHVERWPTTNPPLVSWPIASLARCGQVSTAASFPPAFHGTCSPARVVAGTGLRHWSVRKRMSRRVAYGSLPSDGMSSRRPAHGPGMLIRGHVQRYGVLLARPVE